MSGDEVRKLDFAETPTYRRLSEAHHRPSVETAWSAKEARNSRRMMPAMT